MIKRFFTLNFLISYIFSGLSGLILMAVVLQSCNDESYQIGLELLPEQDDIDVEQVDTLTIETFNIGPAGIPVSDTVYFPFGNYNNEVFGHTRAGMALEFSPAGYYVKINQGAVTDTVIMNIYYDTIYGGADYVPQIEIYELTEGIDKSTRYYTDFDLTGKYDPVNLSISATEKPDTTNMLTLRLQKSLGDELLNLPGLNDSLMFTSYKIDSVFDYYFKGLYLNPVTDNNDKGLITVRSITFTVKFHTEIDTTSMLFAFLPQDTRYLTVDGKSVPMGDKMIKIFEHDYSASAITHLNDSTFQDTVLYLQSLGGAQAILKIPSLEQLRQKVGRVSVNSAELFIPVLSDSAQLFDNFYPSQLGVRILNDANYYLPDDVLYQPSQYVSAFSYMNGTFSKTNWGYNFNMTSYFHEYMKGDINSSRLLIFAGRLDANLRRTNFNPINYNSVVLAGSSNINRKITLRVAYTKL